MPYKFIRRQPAARISVYKVFNKVKGKFFKLR